MKKETVREQIFVKHYDGIITGFPFSDLPKDILPDDIIDLQKTEGYYSENNSWDDHTDLVVYREREETDFEFAKRKDKWNKKMNELRDGRLKLYEKLKKEFE
tara:strand:- start:56 stop:361 length:306 start_codon:yes stop_codon:yes gene_type:complete